MTPEQDQRLRRIETALLDDDGIYPGYPSILNMVSQIRTAAFPNGVVDSAGKTLAHVGTIAKRIADHLGVPSK